jgi:hypothetical protein
MQNTNNYPYLILTVNDREDASVSAQQETHNLPYGVHFLGGNRIEVRKTT